MNHTHACGVPGCTFKVEEASLVAFLIAVREHHRQHARNSVFIRSGIRTDPAAMEAAWAREVADDGPA